MIQCDVFDIQYTCIYYIFILFSLFISFLNCILSICYFLSLLSSFLILYFLFFILFGCRRHQFGTLFVVWIYHKCRIAFKLLFVKWNKSIKHFHIFINTKHQNNEFETELKTLECNRKYVVSDFVYFFQKFGYSVSSVLEINGICWLRMPNPYTITITYINMWNNEYVYCI